MRTESETHHPPRTVRGLYQVGMAGSLYRAVLCILVDVGQDGIGGVFFVRAVYIAATGYCHFVPVFRAAFGNQQIIPAVFLVNVRPFRVPSTRTVPDAFGLVELFAGFGVDFAQIDTYARIADKVTLVVFKIEGRVYAALLEPYGFRPFATRVGSVYKEVAFVGHVGGNHVECTVVVADGGCIDSSPRAGVVKRQL